MPKFEVHIPAIEGGLNLTLRVDAENWMAALKTGLQKLGEQGSTVQNVLVDIQDDASVHVTESRSGRVFSIRELSDAEAAAAPVKRTLSQPPPAAAVEPSQAITQPHLDPITDPPPVPERHAPPAVPPPQASAPQEAPPFATVPSPGRGRPRSRTDAHQVLELERPTRPVTGPIGRSRPPHSEKGKIDEVFSEVFERVQEIYAKPSAESALYFLLDLALEKIPSESGSVYRSDFASGDLSFAAARGPKASELLSAKIVIPSGTGIVGFCAIEGVSLAVSDVEKDPRYDPAVSERLNYQVKSALCSPMMTHGRTFGCIQVLNRQGGPVFTEHEVGILSYIAHQAALYLNRQL